jgi:hypothetical protein
VAVYAEVLAGVAYAIATIKPYFWLCWCEYHSLVFKKATQRGMLRSLKFYSLPSGFYFFFFFGFFGCFSSNRPMLIPSDQLIESFDQSHR